MVRRLVVLSEPSLARDLVSVELSVQSVVEHCWELVWVALSVGSLQVLSRPLFLHYFDQHLCFLCTRCDGLLLGDHGDGVAHQLLWFLVTYIKIFDSESFRDVSLFCDCRSQAVSRPLWTEGFASRVHPDSGIEGWYPFARHRNRSSYFSLFFVLLCAEEVSSSC